MPFDLNNVVPWGRNLDEYQRIFGLTDADLQKKIVSFGDGPASFNAEMTKLNRSVVSLDPIYQFSKHELSARINETKDIILEQTRQNLQNFVWESIKSVEELEVMRLEAMANFINDFDLGKTQNRYLYHELPQLTAFDDKTFDLGLSSHFLILYSQLGLDFHIQAITEMLRVSKEVRIFPLLNLNAQRSEVLDDILSHFETNFSVQIIGVDYEFQKEGHKMLTIMHKTNDRLTDTKI